MRWVKRGPGSCTAPLFRARELGQGEAENGPVAGMEKMDRMSDSGSTRRKPTPIAIIEAAERLFGGQGIENVSLRQIRIEAAAANNSAVSYHFADREALVRAIWEHRLPPLDAMRGRMLDRLRRKGLDGDPHAILSALLLPTYELRDAGGVHRYAAFFRHAMRWRPGAAIRNSQLQLTPHSCAAMALYHGLRPDLPTALLDRRLFQGSLLFYDMVCERDQDLAEGLPISGEAEFLAECIDMVVGICLRPDVAAGGSLVSSPALAIDGR